MNRPQDSNSNPLHTARLDRLVQEAAALASNERGLYLDRICVGDAQLRNELAQRLLEQGLLRPEELQGGSPLNSPIGPWELRRKLGEGGMGSVYLAVRREGSFHQRAAIKLLHAHRQSTESLARFQRERQVLANLDHAGIARLIDGGISQAGIPYLVMEYVEGVRIDRWCDEQRLTIAARLQLFCEVCAAVQHAHQRLVVHRDIKPSNILVTAEGRPKLLDFGIAKMLDPEKEAAELDLTQATALLFTPAFASPEQLRGGTVTTASDVYSLGVLLYHLLTGALPHHWDTSSPVAMQRNLDTAEPPKPSTVVAKTSTAHGRPTSSPQNNPSADVALLRLTSCRQLAAMLRGDLDRIVLMALRKEPLRRYATVHAFAEDVRRYLSGFPVTARGDSLLYRSTRFVQRNRLAVSLSSVTALALVAGLITSHYQYRLADAARAEAVQQRSIADATNRALQQGNQELSEQRRLAEEHLKEARSLAQRLEAAHAQSERRAKEVRQFSTTLIFDLHREVHRLPGARPATERLLRTGLELLDRLAAESTDQPELQRELAGAYLRLADLQAGLFTSNLGQLEAARTSSLKAMALAQQLCEGEAAANDRALLAQALLGSGDLARRFEDQAGALRLYADAEALLSAMGEESSVSARDRYLLATVISRRADLHAASGNYGEAEEGYLAADRIMLDILQRWPASSFVRNDLAAGGALRARIYSAQGDHDRALQVLVESLEHLEALLQLSPTNVEWQRALVLHQLQIGSCLQNQEAYTEASEFVDQALHNSERLLAQDPNNLTLRSDWCQALGAKTALLILMGLWEQVPPYIEKLLPTARELQQSELSTINDLMYIEVALMACKSQLHQGRPLLAGESLSEARKLLERFHVRAPQDTNSRRIYAQCCFDAAAIVLNELHDQSAPLPTEEMASARRALEQAITTWEDLGASPVSTPTDRAQATAARRLLQSLDTP